MIYYKNKDTGELLTREEMLTQWRDAYDGEDPTNALGWAEQYDKVEVDVAPQPPATVYTMEQWKQDGDFKAQAGQEVSEEVYNEMLNAVPPESLPRSKARQALSVYKIPVHYGFLMGEPTSSDKDGALYRAFGMNDYGRSVNHKEPRYFYLGLSHLAPEINGAYYFFECMGLLFNGDRTGLPDNFIPVKVFKDDDEAVDFAVDHEATLYKIEYNHSEEVKREILFEPQF